MNVQIDSCFIDQSSEEDSDDSSDEVEDEEEEEGSPEDPKEDELERQRALVLGRPLDHFDDSDEEGEEDDDDDEEDEDAIYDYDMTECTERGPAIDSGSTAVVALLRGNELYVANAGDSRCVVCRNGILIH